ncbi:hypothetical protein GCM10010339_78350 [Streptomyces alanosinicus]|uniref:Uncharacterized protein n=1 Tax=Streptomyces alanosinicus TaxID=68171 RepID=A0A918YQP6_9ACTN|nr:hypothetical protein GCM10010339_78350 [Streptomyces alanosinicus]
MASLHPAVRLLLHARGDDETGPTQQLGRAVERPILRVRAAPPSASGTLSRIAPGYDCPVSR